MITGRKHIVGVAVAFGLGFGCYDSAQRDEYDPGPDGPGTEAWGDENVTCSEDKDCNESEMCLENVCQMRRCHNGPYASEPPLGSELVFLADQEIGVVDSNAYEGSYWIDRYAPGDASVSYDSSWKLTSAAIRDVAGGNLNEGAPEEIAAAVAGSNEVVILSSTSTEYFDVGFAPVAVATGDLDADGNDELMAMAANGEMAICSTGTSECTEWSFEGQVTGLDLAAADVDGDGRAEAIALIEVEGSQQLVVANPDHEDTAQQASYGLVLQHDDLSRVVALDLDGDFMAEVVALKDPGCHIWCPEDSLVVFRLDGSTDGQLAQWDSPWDDLVDLAGGDLAADDSQEIVLLSDDERKVRVLHAGPASDFELVFEDDVSANSAPDRVAVTDYDGDSPSGRLVDGPEMCNGRPVPLFVAYYPPYWAQYSDTPANVYIGDSELTVEAYSDTISLKSSIELGVDADLLGLFKAGFSVKVAGRVSKRYTQRNVRFVGNRVWTQARPDLYGPQYAAVLMSYACTHVYTYMLYDPSHKTGDGHGKEFVLTVPVDGSTTAMSSARYNALAKALGGLPEVIVPHMIGDPSTYPTELRTIEGEAIPPGDLVVENPPNYMVSDVGYLGFWLAIWDYVGEETSAEIEVSVEAKGTLAGFTFGSELGAGWGKGHTIEMGREAVFGGNLPTLPDDPSTPEDEYEENAYSFAPIVYRAHYEDINGKDAGYYVFHWMVGLP